MWRLQHHNNHNSTRTRRTLAWYWVPIIFSWIPSWLIKELYHVPSSQPSCLPGNLSKYKSPKLHIRTMNLILKIRFCLTILNKIIWALLTELSIINIQVEILILVIHEMRLQGWTLRHSTRIDSHKLIKWHLAIRICYKVKLKLSEWILKIKQP